MFNPRPIEDQVIVLTGATSGIGLVTARLAAARGARLVLAARSAAALEELVEELESDGHEAIAVPTDVGVRQQVIHLGERAVERFGRIDTWINDAAVTVYGRITEVDMGEQRRLFDTNYWGYVYGCLEAIRHMRERGGHIISVASVLSTRAIPLQGPYCASKHAVQGFHDALRMELQEEGVPIRISLIKPSATDTPYKDRARNYLPVAPKNPPPVYAPETVARAILSCLEHPRREIVVGFGGKSLTVLGKLFPTMTDWIMGHTMFGLQHSDRPAGPRDSHTLYEPRERGLRERGLHSQYVHETSAYTQMRLHPLVTVGAAVAAGLACTDLVRRARPRSAVAVMGAAMTAAATWMLLVSREHGAEQPTVGERLRSLRNGVI